MSDRPTHEIGEIFAVQKVGEYFQFTVIAPGVATGFEPGHFVAEESPEEMLAALTAFLAPYRGGLAEARDAGPHAVVD